MNKNEALTLALVVEEFDNNDESLPLELLKPITATLRALAQPWPDLTEQQREAYQKGHNDGVAHHKQAIKAAQPEQEPVATTYKEVTDAMNLLLNGDYKQFQMAQLMADAKLYTTPPTREWVALTDEPAQPKPVAWMCNAFDGKVCEQSNHDECENPIPLYTTPPKRQPLTDDEINKCDMCGYVGKDKDSIGQCPKCRWDELRPLVEKARQKPLTDDQIYDMYNEPRSDAEMLEFARAIEAAHGIKEKNT
jgi:hypothetical protein